jgi:hypothetical protein
MPSLKEKVVLDQSGPDSYVVRSLVNRLSPDVDSVITKAAVEKLIQNGRGKVTVTIKSRVA